MTTLDIEALIEEQIRRLRTLSPPIEAFGIGGSFGHREQYPSADADFFLLYPSELLLSKLQSFPTEISHPLTPLTVSELEFYFGFGFQYVFIFSNGLMVEYFLNSRETLTFNPMRSGTRVIHDATGFFTDFTSGLSIPVGSLRERAFDQLVHKILMHILTIKKYAVRGDVLALLHRLDGLRQSAIALDRYRLRGEIIAAHDADKKLGDSLGSAYIEQISTTIPSLEAGSLLHAFSTLRAKILDRLAETGTGKISSPDFYALELRLSEEIQCALEGLASRTGRM